MRRPKWDGRGAAPDLQGYGKIPGPTKEPAQGPSSFALLLFADMHGDLDGSALEAELLAQTAFQIAAVAMLQEAGSEDYETWRPGGGLGGEEDPRLLAAPQRMWVRGLNLAQEGVELAGRYALVP